MNESAIRLRIEPLDVVQRLRYFGYAFDRPVLAEAGRLLWRYR